MGSCLRGEAHAGDPRRRDRDLRERGCRMKEWNLDSMKLETELSTGLVAGTGNGNAAVFEYIKRLADSGFFGAVTLKYEAGRIVHLRKEENLKPSELSESPRFSDEHR